MNALIVTQSKQLGQAIAGVVGYVGRFDTAFAETAEEAMALMQKTAFDLVIINDSTERGRQAAVSASNESGVIFFESAKNFEKSALALAEKGIVVVPKPLSKMALLTAVQTVYAAGLRLAGLKEKNKSLNREIEDIKIIDRAKIALIERLGYTEAEAHKYIEKQAMNLRTNKREIAMNILRTYEY